MKEEWITIGDNKVCRDCQALSGRIEDSKYWDLTGRPRQRETLCDGSCRCMLFPVEEKTTEFDKVLDEVIDEYMKGVVIDKTTGGKIVHIKLDEFSEIAGVADVSYELIDKLEKMIVEWKILNGYQKLPDEYFELADIKKQIKWLEERV